MGWKDWVYGDLVSAADFQSLVQDQTVQRYASSAARSATLGSAVAEGMVSYLDDTNAVEVYNGSAWTGVSSSGSGNAIINGAFDIWQRGTSVNAGVFTYVSDRWATVATHSGGTVAYTKQTFTPGSSPISGVPNYIRMTATSPTGASANTLYQRIEDVNSFAGQTVTLSFYAKADATRSIAINPFQDFGSGGSSQVGITGTTVSATTTMQRFSYTFAVPSITGKTVGTSSYLGIELQFPVNTTSTFEITGVQLEAGSSATAFKRNASSIQAELAACQRYYWRWTADTNFATCGIGAASSGTLAVITVNHPVPMRTKVASIDGSANSTMRLQDQITGYTQTAASIEISQQDIFKTDLNISVSSGLNQYRFYRYGANNSTSAYLGFSAEL